MILASLFFQCNKNCKEHIMAEGLKMFYARNERNIHSRILVKRY